MWIAISKPSQGSRKQYGSLHWCTKKEDNLRTNVMSLGMTSEKLKDICQTLRQLPKQSLPIWIRVGVLHQMPMNILRVADNEENLAIKMKLNDIFDYNYSYLMQYRTGDMD